MQVFAPAEDRVIVFKFLYRPLSYPLSAAALALSLHPNFVTFIGFLTLIASNLLALSGQILLSLILLVFAQILDGVDGNVARATATKTYMGKLIDGFTDVFSNTVFASLSIGFMRMQACGSLESFPLVYGLIFSFSPIFYHIFMIRLGYVSSMLPPMSREKSKTLDKIIKPSSRLYSPKKVLDYLDTNFLPCCPLLLLISFLLSPSFFELVFACLAVFCLLIYLQLAVGRLYINREALMMQRN